MAYRAVVPVAARGFVERLRWQLSRVRRHLPVFITDHMCSRRTTICPQQWGRSAPHCSDGIERDEWRGRNQRGTRSRFRARRLGSAPLVFRRWRPRGAELRGGWTRAHLI